VRDAGLEIAELGRCLVTGAAGYLGSHLVRALAARGLAVRAFDRRAIEAADPRVEPLRGDVTRLDDLRKACEGVDSVFHTAAVFHFARFARPAQRAEAQAVNVGGVENLVRAAAEAGVRRLVHTSSNNVTFGAPVFGGDESRAYADGARDLYTATKIAGERAALAADGRAGLRTCALRPGGIYGPGERMMLGRVVDEAARGRFVATLGDRPARCDNVYVENLVDAQLAAARHLFPGSPVCGRAYFVSDGAPANAWEFFRPLLTGLGLPFPRWNVPTAPALAGALAAEWAHRWLRTPAPFLTHLEVRKTALSHWNSNARAQRDFGWRPPVPPERAMQETIAAFRAERAAHGATPDSGAADRR
jgi:3beta-hydroxy-delta5-steroid dehydrogenase/steroid delta-isomerase